jgi:fluoride exporter
MNYLIVFIGGGLGSVARYAAGKYIGIQAGNSLPFATITVNAISSFILGLLAVKIVQRPDDSSLWLLIAVGFCGGFSTFSAFTLELFDFMKNGMVTLALINIAVSVSVCLLTIWLGYIIGNN